MTTLRAAKIPFLRAAAWGTIGFLSVCLTGSSAPAGFVQSTATFTTSRGTPFIPVAGVRAPFFPFPAFRAVFAPSGGGTGRFDLTSTAVLSARFPDQLAAPGTASLTIEEAPGTLTARETEGVQIEATLDPFNTQPDPTVGGPFGIARGVLFDSRFQDVPSPLGTPLTTSAIATINNPFTSFGAPIPGLLDIALDPSYSRDETITLKEVLFDLEAVNRQTGTVVSAPALGFNPFMLSQNVDLNLPEPGIWDVSLGNLLLSGELTKVDSFGMNFQINILFVTPVQAFLQLSPVQRRQMLFSAAGTTATENEFEDWFSIEVLAPANAVPEPSGLLLLALGTTGIIGYVTRRHYVSRQTAA